jgi:transcriptional regulator with XRE-family HTH domain
MRLKLPNRVAAIRSARNLKMIEVANAVEVNPSQISKLERSEIPLNQEWMNRLAPVLSCDPWEFLPQWAERSPAEHIVRIWGDVEAEARPELLEILTTNYDALVENGADNLRVEHAPGSGMTGALTSKLVQLRVDDSGTYNLTIFYRPRPGAPRPRIKLREKG